MALYQLINLDVWGNARDGFEVNAAYSTNTYVELPLEATDAEIIKILKKEDVIKKGIRASSVKIEGEPEYSLYFYHAKTMRPEFELRRVED